jgi:hypothetical protein
LVRQTGDVLQDTGATTGLKQNCEVGDHVVTIGPEQVRGRRASIR